MYFSSKTPTYKHDHVYLPGFTAIQLLVDKFIINRAVDPATLTNQLVYAATHYSQNVPVPFFPSGCDSSKVLNGSTDLFAAWASLTYAPQFVEVSPFPQTAFTHNQVRRGGRPSRACVCDLSVCVCVCVL